MERPSTSRARPTSCGRLPDVRRREPLVLLAIGLALLVLSGIQPKDRSTWFLEVVPIFAALPVLLLTARIGAVTSQLLLAHRHDRELAEFLPGSAPL